MNERLKKIRENLKLTQKEIAEKVGISLRAWQNYELGLRKVPTNLVKTLYEQLSVNPIWLLTGEGPMFKEEAGEIGNETEKPDPLEKALQMMKMLNNEDREDVLKYIKRVKQMREMEKKITKLEKLIKEKPKV